MTRVLAESPVSLDSLDDHLKALLRLKLREFVHLSPWFRDIPSIDPMIYASPVKPMGAAKQTIVTSKVMRFERDHCPRRKHSGSIGRRYVRSGLHLN